MITEILKSKTAFQHKTLEEKMHSHKIMSGNFSLADYFRMFEMNYRFISNFEKEIFDLIPLDLAQKLNLNKRSKLSHIQKDAAQISLAISDEIAHEQITNPAQALGVLYVMEGAILGGNVIAKKLKQQADFQEFELHYFGVYGDKTGEMWINFKNILNQTIQSKSDQEQCLLGAEMAYDYLLNLDI